MFAFTLDYFFYFFKNIFFMFIYNSLRKISKNFEIRRKSMKILFIACILSGFKETIVEILMNHNYKESSARWIGNCIGISLLLILYLFPQIVSINMFL